MRLILAVALLSGCSGPSRKQYADLLHECREVNREHLRMLKEYEAMRNSAVRYSDVRDLKSEHKIGDQFETNDGCNTCSCLQQDAHSAVCACTLLSCFPAQAHGAAEFNLGGF